MEKLFNAWKWSLQFWWIPTFILVFSLISQNLFTQNSDKWWGFIPLGIIIVFLFFSTKYAVGFYKKLKNKSVGNFTFNTFKEFLGIK